MAPSPHPQIWLAAGVRTPFAKVDGPLAGLDAIGMSVPLAEYMIGHLDGALPDLAVWGSVVPNLTWSNIAREVLMDAGVGVTVPAFSTVMACSTSMVGAFEAAGMLDGRGRDLALVGGVDSLSHIQIGLSQPLSDWVRKFQLARSLGDRISHLAELKLGNRAAVRARRRQPHDRAQHGRAHRDHRQAMGHRPRRTGRHGAAEPSARRRRLGSRLLRRPGRCRSAISNATPFRAATPRWKGWPACRRLSTRPAVTAR